MFMLEPGLLREGTRANRSSLFGAPLGSVLVPSLFEFFFLLGH